MPDTDTSPSTDSKSRLQSPINYLKAGIDHKANFMLALGKSLLVFPSQPLHVIMRYQQSTLASSSPRVLPMTEAYKEIRLNQGMSALFKGVKLGATKELTKTCIYKGTLITGAPQLAESILPTAFKNYTSNEQYRLVKCIVAGCIASLSDATLGGAMDRIATFQSTSQGEKADASFSKEFHMKKSVSGKVSFLYKGFFANASKGAFAFSTMFYLSQPIRNWTAAFYNHSPQDKAPWYSSGTSAILGGIAVAIASSPLDIVKTQAQMPGSKDIGLYQSLRDNYSRHGLRGVTAGLPAKTMMITLGWSLNSFFMQKMDEHKEKSNPSERRGAQLGA